MRVRIWLACSLLLAIVCVLGCGSRSNNSGTAQFRLVQGSPGAPQVNLLVDKVSVATNVNYGGSTTYLTVNSGSRHIQVVPVSGSASPILDQTLAFAASAKQTLVLTGPPTGIQPVVLTDGGTPATTGDGQVRVLNASATMGPADVYIVLAGASIAGVTPQVSNLAFDKDTGYQLLIAGNYEVFLTAPGTKNAFLSSGPINLAANADQTIVALDGVISGFTFALLVDQ